MEEIILKQLTHFTTVTKDQLFRLTKSYKGHISKREFDEALDELIQEGKVEGVHLERSFEYRLT